MTVGRLIGVDSVELWVETHAPPTDARVGEPVVLLSGSDAPTLRWSPGLINRLLAAGHPVVAYDHRDSGRSSPWPADRGYTLDDLAADAVGVLDELEIDSAHLLGYSMGAMVAQLLAIEHPDRVRTLTLVASSPGPSDPQLEAPDPAFTDLIEARMWELIPRDEAARIEWLIERQRPFAGGRGLDEERERALAAAEVLTCWRPESGHGPAVAAASSRLERLGAIRASTLVIHGESDPLFPPQHGVVTAEAIADAELVLVPELGHEAPDWLWPLVWDRLAEHLASAPRTGT